MYVYIFNKSLSKLLKENKKGFQIKSKREKGEYKNGKKIKLGERAHCPKQRKKQQSD